MAEGKRGTGQGELVHVIPPRNTSSWTCVSAARFLRPIAGDTPTDMKDGDVEGEPANVGLQCSWWFIPVQCDGVCHNENTPQKLHTHSFMNEM